MLCVHGRQKLCHVTGHVEAINRGVFLLRDWSRDCILETFLGFNYFFVRVSKPGVREKNLGAVVPRLVLHQKQWRTL